MHWGGHSRTPDYCAAFGGQPPDGWQPTSRQDGNEMIFPPIGPLAAAVVNIVLFSFTFKEPAKIPLAE